MPHIFHGEDSNLARNLIMDYNEECFSIHDAFGISHTNVSKLIISTNFVINNNRNTKRNFYMNTYEFKKQTFSKFIIL